MSGHGLCRNVKYSGVIVVSGGCQVEVTGEEEVHQNSESKNSEVKCIKKVHQIVCVNLCTIVYLGGCTKSPRTIRGVPSSGKVESNCSRDYK